MQICFAHDVFRSACNAGNADVNGLWLHNLLAPVLTDLGHSVHRFSETDAEVARAVSTLLAARAPASHAAWAATLSDPDLLDEVTKVCWPLQQFDLVVGYELTPNQMRFLAAAGTPFLDISIDPVRFAPDLFLKMRTNDDAVSRVLQAYDQPAETLLPHVAWLRSNTARALPQDSPTTPCLLFAGQTDVDASLVTGGKLASVEDFIDDIRDLLKPGWRLLLKPHPYGRAHQSIRTLRKAFPNARTVNDNIYALINAPFVEHVVTLSSGAAQEARLFGQSATMLITPDNTRAGVGAGLVSRDHRVGLDVLSPAFWEDIGKGGSAVSRAVSRRAGPSRPASLNGALRRALGQSWGYVAAPRLTQRILSPGQALFFGKGGEGVGLCTFGWSHPEASGLWSDGPLATMLVDVGGRALDLVLECSGFVPFGRGPVDVDIRIKPGVMPAQHIAFHNRRRTRVVIELPPVSGPVEIEFTVSGATSPKAASLSDDARVIGLKVIRATAVPRRHQGAIAGSLASASAHMGDWMRIAASLIAGVIGWT